MLPCLRDEYRHASVSAGVVQGSEVGPSAFIIDASDLQPLHQENITVEYADDTNLIIGASQRHNVMIGEQLKLVYAAPAWWGYDSTEDRVRLERFLSRAHRMGSPV